MTRVQVLATGGTIASRPGPDGIAPVLTGDAILTEVLAEAPALRASMDLTVAEPFRRPSYTLTPAEMLVVALEARAALTAGCDAVIVLHGTDTVADTAWLTELLVAPLQVGPVIFVSAMRHAGELGADGPRNLLDALRVCGTPRARGRGALVMANGQIHSAARVVKSHASALTAFSSPGIGPVGDVTGQQVRFTRPASAPLDARGRTPHFADPGAVPALADVGVVHAWTGHGNASIDTLLAEGVTGLVVEGVGAGHVRPDAVAGFEKACAAGIPVTVTSRAGGPVHRGYGGGPGAGIWLDQTPALPSGELGTARAQLALALGLAAHGPGPALAEWFARVMRYQSFTL